MEALIKKQFVKAVLEEEAKRYNSNQSAKIQRLLNFHSGNLLSGRHFSVLSGQEMDGKLEIKHPDYLRFLDMKRVIKRKQSVKITRGKRKGERHSINKPGVRVKRGYAIHNKFAMGHYYSIANRLLFEFTDQVAENIKKELTSKTPA